MKNVTNPMEWLTDPAVEDALWMCGFRPKNQSDYENWASLATALEQMPGHPTKEWVAKKLLSLNLPPLTPSNREALWRKGSDFLLLHPQPVCRADFGARPNAGNPPKTIQTLSNVAFFPTVPTDYEAWIEQLDRALPSESAALFLPQTYAFVKPDLYHVRACLAGRMQNENLLLNQLARIFCEKYRKNGGFLALQTACEPKEVSAMLCELFETVGLPELLWAPTSPKDFAILPSLCRQSDRPIRPAILPNADWTDEEFADLLRFVSTLVPLERVVPLVGKSRFQTVKKQL